jgi:zinc transporter, ZIP family
MDLVLAAAKLVAFPVMAAIIGAVVSVVRPPGVRFVAGVQHFAAGVVMAALVGEIMPELSREGHLFWTVAGFVLGAILVLALGAYGRRSEERALASVGTGNGGTVDPVEVELTDTSLAMGEALLASKQAVERAEAEGALALTEGKPTSVIAGRVAKVALRTVPIGMLAAIMIDLLLDGILIGLGVRLGARQGLILAIALTLEILFLALSVTSELRDGGMSKVQAVATCTVLGLTTAVGAIGGAAVLGGVDTTVMSAILGLGAAALLYLVVEELLVEAHEVKESMLLSANFFLGFILIYILAAME